MHTGLANDGGFFLQVSDTGKGIARGDLHKTLTNFGQVDGSLNRKYEGAGLGLSLCRRLAELHGRPECPLRVSSRHCQYHGECPLVANRRHSHLTI